MLWSKSCLFSGCSVGSPTCTCLQLCFGVDLVFFFFSSAACIRWQELTVGIPSKGGYKYEAQCGRREQSHSMEPQLLVTKAPSCNSNLHSICSFFFILGAWLRVFPCAPMRRGPPRELTPAETEKQGKSPADTHAHRLSCLSQRRVQHVKHTESQGKELG